MVTQRAREPEIWRSVCVHVRNVWSLDELGKPLKESTTRRLSMAAWQHGSMAVWQYGSMAVWNRRGQDSRWHCLVHGARLRFTGLTSVYRVNVYSVHVCRAEHSVQSDGCIISSLLPELEYVWSIGRRAANKRPVAFE